MNTTGLSGVNLLKKRCVLLVTWRENKLECFSLPNIFKLVVGKSLPEWSTVIGNQLYLDLKTLAGANTLAYPVSVTKKQTSFTTMTQDRKTPQLIQELSSQNLVFKVAKKKKKKQQTFD